MEHTKRTINSVEEMTTPQSDADGELSEIWIRPTSGLASLQLGSVWEFRDLLFFLVLREIRGRYRQMAFGPLWIVLQPVIQMLLFTFVFGRIANLETDGNVPYPIFVYVALLPWQFFANSTRQASFSLVDQKHVISKVYFPRLIIPIAASLAALVDFFASFVILLGMMVVYRVPFTAGILTLPLFMMLAMMLSLGVGTFLAGLAVKFRDVMIGLGFIMTVWQYLTPVAYSLQLIPENVLFIYRLNPMTAVVEGFRWAILGTSPAPDSMLLINLLVILVVLVGGIAYFRATERTIVDVI